MKTAQSIAVSIAMFFALSAPAYAQATQCFPRAVLVKALTEKAHEVRFAIGMIDEQHIMETFGAPGGSWTLFVTRSDGMSCLIAAGDNWVWDTKAFDTKEPGGDM